MSRSKDRNAENILKQELAIPPKTQQKIEAAYDIVRARANERQKTGDRSGKMAGDFACPPDVVRDRLCSVYDRKSCGGKKKEVTAGCRRQFLIFD